MSLTWLVWLALGAAPELASAAALSPRPVHCASTQGLWQRAEQAERAARCALLARAHTRLVSDPQAARELAQRLLKSELRAHALVLSGRADLQLGQFARAWQQFQAAAALDQNVFHDLAARQAVAQAAALQGQVKVAAERYKSLIPLRSLLPTARQQSLLFEATLALSNLGPEHHAAALDVLNLWQQARAGRPSTLAERALELLLSARGEPEFKRAPELECEAMAVELAQAKYALLPAADRVALSAIACENVDVHAAIEHWTAFAAAPDRPLWRKWASERLARLQREALQSGE